MNILFIGDIDGRPGRNAVKKALPELIKEHKIDLTVANIENATSGNGITEEAYKELKNCGVDVFTSGNHIWSKKEILPFLDDKNEPIVRPANYPPGVPGKGVWTLEIGSTSVVIANIMGRVFMHANLDDPFRAADQIIKDHPNHLIIIDFHAEATSEKRAFGFYLDGKVAAVLGTHTHVPTADAQILPNGTAYISDVGYVGPLNSVIGVEKDIIIRQFLTQCPQQYENGKGDVEFNAVFMKSKGNKIISIEHIRKIVTN